jgi:hypothetical protein
VVVWRPGQVGTLLAMGGGRCISRVVDGEAALLLPVELAEAVESERPARYSRSEGMLSAMVGVCLIRGFA